MSIRLVLVMLTLTGGLIMMTAPVRAEQDIAIYLATNSALENTERNVRDKDDATLTPEDQNRKRK
jgi:hyperosmotically inducible protein